MDPDWWKQSTSRTELWYVWLEIAIENEARALAARSDAFSARDAGGQVPAALEKETKATMLAAVAAAAAVENIANNLNEFLEATVNARGTALRVVKVIDSIFGDVVSDSLRDEIRWLFDYRNETVHHRADWFAIERHPVVGVPTTRVARFYSLESATRSVRVAFDVLSVATKPGRSQSSAAESWARRFRSLPSELDHARGNLAADS